MFAPKLNPLIVAIPILKPVNEPGPLETTNPSISFIVNSQSFKRFSIIGINKTECSLLSLITYSPSKVSSLSSATVATLDEESILKTIIFLAPLRNHIYLHKG